MQHRSLYASLLLAIGVLVAVPVVRYWRARGPRVFAQLKAAPGLRDGATVVFRGVAVGTVKDITAMPEGVQLTLALDRSDVPLRQRDGARVKSLGILGDVVVELVPGPSSAPPLAAGMILREAPPDTLEQWRRARAAAALGELARGVIRPGTQDSSARGSVKP